MNQTEQKEGCSLRVEIEKLDGGYISNVTGKRRIFNNPFDIDDAIDMKSILSQIKENEYILSIDLVPKDKYQIPLIEEEKVEDISPLSILEQAKRDGIIQPAEKFNPEFSKKGVIEDNSIAITVNNCYSIAELQAINWTKYDKEIPLSNSEKSKISGIKDSTFYNLWVKVAAGTFQWQSVGTRIGMTILAKYYEKIIEKKEKKFSIPPRNDKRLLELITEIELLAKSSVVKSNVLLKKTDQIKKLLIQY